MILVRLYTFDCTRCFSVMDGNFMDFVILKDYKALPQCMSFLSLSSLGVS